MQYKHSELSWYPCDHFGKRFSNFNDLDDHIEKEHSSTKNSNSRKNIDIRNVNNKKPCNPSDPSHTSRCCDRKRRYETKPRYETRNRNSYTKETNGPCRFWNNDGYCSYGGSCKYAHVEICRFQGSCRYGSSDCRFFHFKDIEQENSFVGNRFQERFQERNLRR